MVKFHRIGFYESGEAVRWSATGSRGVIDQRVVEYLNGGKIVLASAQWVDDLLDANKRAICQFAILTDGVWVWPSSLSYYYETYGVDLPTAFLDDVRNRDWIVPPLEDSLVDSIGEWLTSDDPS